MLNLVSDRRPSPIRPCTLLIQQRFHSRRTCTGIMRNTGMVARGASRHTSLTSFKNWSGHSRTGRTMDYCRGLVDIGNFSLAAMQSLCYRSCALSRIKLADLRTLWGGSSEPPLGTGLRYTADLTCHSLSGSTVSIVYQLYVCVPRV